MIVNTARAHSATVPVAAHSAGPAQAVPLVPPGLLAGANRILFVTHLAIGDFTYLQAGLRAFARAFPHVRIHLWVDERRRTADPEAWPILRKYALFDWLAACPWIDKVYDSTYSPETFERSVGEARAEDYPVVASLAVVDCHRYARLARRISPRGFVLGITKPAERVLHMPSRWAGYRRLDARLPMYTPDDCARQHISDIYAGWFARCFGVEVPPAARLPRLDLPERWVRAAHAQFADWNFAVGRPVVFLNPYSKSPDRTWPLEYVVGLARALRTRAAWADAGIVVNVVPEALDDARRACERRADPLLAQVRLFSAEEHFFQLPAIMRLCALVISVETAVMHLANAVGVPVVALMRRNHPEWAPIDRARSTVLMVPEMDDWLTRIGVDDVLAVLDAQYADAVHPPSPR
jgi:ADP-heptose:LPS heptosyltransferase